MLALLMHLIPTFLVLRLLAAAWRWEWFGALSFAALGLGYIIGFWGRFHWMAYVMIAGRLLLLGGLFGMVAGYFSAFWMGLLIAGLMGAAFFVSQQGLDLIRSEDPRVAREIVGVEDAALGLQELSAHLHGFLSGITIADTIYARLTTDNLINLTIMTFVVTILAGLYPAVMASRMQPVVALRAEK